MVRTKTRIRKPQCDVRPNESLEAFEYTQTLIVIYINQKIIWRFLFQKHSITG
jgi:hypothetical protein